MDSTVINGVVYPATDGQPMGETGFHVGLVVNTFCALRWLFHRRPNVYISGDMFMYYVAGDPTQRVTPDTFVVFDVPSHERYSWFVWEEGKAPDVIFEFTSRKTRSADQGTKKGLYEWLGVKEYFMFDPLGDYLRPRLQGYRLVEGAYRPIPLVAEQMESEQLGLRLKAAGNTLDLIDARTGERLLPPAEESEARRAAETEVARLRAELARLRQG
ncbi:MAG: Uma2 family endonuclease [Chloroflexota bacterium]